MFAARRRSRNAKRNLAMLTRLWTRFGHRLGINSRPHRRRSLIRGCRLEHLEPRALLSAQVASLVAPPDNASMADAPAAMTARPQQVTRLEAFTSDAGQLELRWKGGAGGNEFVIYAGRAEIGRVSGDTHSFAVEDFAAGRSQQFRVEARNELGSRTITREIWVPRQELPMLEDFSITVSSKGIYTLHLTNARTNDVLRVSYTGTSGRRTIFFEAGQTSCRLNGVSRAGGLLELDASAIRSRYGSGAGVQSDVEFQMDVPRWRREL